MAEPTTTAAAAPTFTPPTFTPGPWQFWETWAEVVKVFESGASRRIAECATDHVTHHVSLGECRANARLIAAAPAMAEALLWIRENLHPRALGRGATDAELLAITYATMALRQGGVIPTPELQDAGT